MYFRLAKKTKEQTQSRKILGIESKASQIHFGADYDRIDVL